MKQSIPLTTLKILQKARINKCGMKNEKMSKSVIVTKSEGLSNLSCLKARNIY